LIDAVQPDVIFTHGFNGPVMVQALRWRYGLKAPMVCSYHGEYHPPRSNRRFIAPLFNGVMHALYRSRAVSSVVTVADYCKEFLVSCGVPAAKITVVHNGIAPHSLHSLNALKKERVDLFDSAFVVGMASRIEPIKGIEEAIDAIHAIHAERWPLNIKLVILGDGPQRGALEEKVKQLGLEKVVYFEGVQSHVAEWMEAFDVFLLPSYFEYHSIAILEAMRAGKAIVATAVGGTPESIRHEQEGLLVPAKDVQVLTDALMRLGGDKQLRETLGAAARNRFELEFTEDVMKRKLAAWLLGDR
jgi:glycosyltransferase involved in cell wall biosynthesis